MYCNYCRLPHFATRAALLSTEALKSKGHFQEAALVFIKMTSEVSILSLSKVLPEVGNMKLQMTNCTLLKENTLGSQ